MRFEKCIDASAWKGVRFAIRGHFWGCSIAYASSDVQHEDRSAVAPFATGNRGSRPPQTELTLSWGTRSAQLVQVPFDHDDVSVSRARPPLPLDRSKLTSLRWTFSDSTSDRCETDLFIEDLAFY
jgi:hypothetical protein